MKFAGCNDLLLVRIHLKLYEIWLKILNFTAIENWEINTASAPKTVLKCVFSTTLAPLFFKTFLSETFTILSKAPVDLIENI